MTSVSTLPRSPYRAGRGALRRLEKIPEWHLQRVGDPNERMQRHVAAALELRDPLKRGAEQDAELLLRHLPLFSQLGDPPADAATNAVGIEGAHIATLPFVRAGINKVIPLVIRTGSVQSYVDVSREIMTARERIRILLIDDDAAVRRSVRRALADQFEVVEAVDGVDAIRLLRQQRFDVVVSDLEMPNVDGAGVVAWLERHQPALAKRVLVVTGGPRDPARQAWLDSFDEERVLLKPCSAKELSDAIGRLTRRGAS